MAYACSFVIDKGREQEVAARMLESALAKELSSILSHIPAYPGRHTNSALSRATQLEKSAQKDQNGMPGTPVFSDRFQK